MLWERDDRVYGTQPSFGIYWSHWNRGFRSKTVSDSQTGIPRRRFYKTLKCYQKSIIGSELKKIMGAVFLLDHQAELAGTVLSGPAVKVPSHITPAILLAGKMLSALIPKFGLLKLDADGVSRDPAVVQAYVSDPLVYTGKATARLSFEMLKAMQSVSHQASQITLPIMIVQGGADRLIDPVGAEMLYHAVTSTHKEIRIYEGFYHEVFNEPGT